MSTDILIKILPPATLIIGFLAALPAFIVSNSGGIISYWFNFPSFRRQYLAYFKNFSRHNMYNAPRFAEVYINRRELTDAIIEKLLPYDELQKK